MIRTYFPDAIWWGQAPRRPGLECDRGVLTHAARSLRGGSWVAVCQPPGELALAAYAQRRPRSRAAQ